MDRQLKDKVAIVTGGAKGIGAAIVRACAGEGAVPMIVDRDAEAEKQLQNELKKNGANCALITVDLETPESSSQAVEQTLKEFGRIAITKRYGPRLPKASKIPASRTWKSICSARVCS